MLISLTRWANAMIRSVLRSCRFPPAVSGFSTIRKCGSILSNDQRSCTSFCLRPFSFEIRLTSDRKSVRASFVGYFLDDGAERRKAPAKRSLPSVNRLWDTEFHRDADRCLQEGLLHEGPVCNCIAQRCQLLDIEVKLVAFGSRLARQEKGLNQTGASSREFGAIHRARRPLLAAADVTDSHFSGGVTLPIPLCQ